MHVVFTENMAIERKFEELKRRLAKAAHDRVVGRLPSKDEDPTLPARDQHREVAVIGYGEIEEIVQEARTARLQHDYQMVDQALIIAIIGRRL